MSENLLVTKYYLPSPAPNHAPRPRLYQLLDDGLHLGRRLTLVSAPAGYGKTTLLSEWIHDRKLSTAWISLDEGDNDPIRFFSYLVAAIRAIKPDLGELSPFQISPGNPFEPTLVSLINGLANLPGPFLIVLDDYHTIHVQSIHDSLNFLIENLPPHVQVIIASRADPPLAIARMRARSQLNELRLSDLRFIPEETAVFLNQVIGLSLSPEDISGLDSRTEGWAAGLQMAALALYAQTSAQDKNVSGFIRSFTGSNRYILDYFVEEVLRRQPEAILAFLEQTSILERLCGPLCDAVIEVRDWRIEPDERFVDHQVPISGKNILEYLDHANLFIVPLDDQREWYRYHRLFADLLNQRLLLTQPESIPILHQRASSWFERHQYMDEAIRHAFAAGNTQRAAALIEAEAETTLMRSEIATFTRWIEQLPELELRARPDLMVYYALTLLWSGAPLEVIDARLSTIEQGKTVPGKEAPLRAFIAINNGQVSLAQEYCRQAIEQIPQTDLLLRGLADLIQAICYMVEGQVQRGVQLLEKATIKNRKTGNLIVAVLVLYQLAELRQKEGQYRHAQALYQQALDLTTDAVGQYQPIAGRAMVGLGEISWAWNDLELAQRYILEGIELSEKWSQVSAFDGYVALVAIRESQGDLEGVEQALKVLRKIAHQFDVTDVDDLVVDMLEARLKIAQGNLAEAHRWARQRGLEDIPIPKADEIEENIINKRLIKYELLVVARLWLAEGHQDEALALLDKQLTQLEKIDRPVLLIETELLRALAFLKKREKDKALLALEHALTLAEPEGFVRIFVDEGEKIQSLIKSAQSKLTEKSRVAFIEKLLLSFASQTPRSPSVRAPGSEILIDPLSDREIDVLHLLPSSLTSQEIADKLYISVHTTRSHLKNIYTKLGVHCRYDALIRAQELGLL